MYAEADNSASETKVEALVRRIENLEATVEKQSATIDKQTIIIQHLLHKSGKGEFHFDFDKMSNVSVKTVEKLLLHYIKVQSTLVILNSKGLSKILRDIRTSTYQICGIENKNNSINHI